MEQSCIPFQHLPKKNSVQIKSNFGYLQRNCNSFIYLVAEWLNEVTQTSVNKSMPNNYMHKDIMTYDNETLILVFYITNLMAATWKAAL